MINHIKTKSNKEIDGSVKSTVLNSDMAVMTGFLGIDLRLVSNETMAALGHRTEIRVNYVRVVQQYWEMNIDVIIEITRKLARFFRNHFPTYLHGKGMLKILMALDTVTK